MNKNERWVEFSLSNCAVWVLEVSVKIISDCPFRNLSGPWDSPTKCHNLSVGVYYRHMNETKSKIAKVPTWFEDMYILEFKFCCVASQFAVLRFMDFKLHRFGYWIDCFTIFMITLPASPASMQFVCHTLNRAITCTDIDVYVTMCIS